MKHLGGHQKQTAPGSINDLIKVCEKKKRKCEAELWLLHLYLLKWCNTPELKSSQTEAVDSSLPLFPLIPANYQPTASLAPDDQVVPQTGGRARLKAKNPGGTGSVCGMFTSSTFTFFFFFFSNYEA